MNPAAIGVKMHSGWGALVAVSHNSGKLEILDRRRIAVTIPGTPGAVQPYHFVENFKLEEAEKFLANCFANSSPPGRKPQSAKSSTNFAPANFA